MVEKLFWSVCAAVILSAGVMIALGSFTNEVAVIYGFIAFALTFMGMMMILPHSVSHSEPQRVETEATPGNERTESRPTRAGLLKSA